MNTITKSHRAGVAIGKTTANAVEAPRLKIADFGENDEAIEIRRERVVAGRRLSPRSPFLILLGLGTVSTFASLVLHFSASRVIEQQLFASAGVLFLALSTSVADLTGSSKSK